MLNEIIEGVSEALHGAFGDGFRIYRDDVRQGLKEPCFLIAALEPGISPLPMGRYQETDPLDVHFFPADPGDRSGMIRAAEEMYWALEAVELPGGGKVRGVGRRYEISDGVLHFFVSYNPTIRREEGHETMGTLSLSAGTDDERQGEELWP